MSHPTSGQAVTVAAHRTTWNTHPSCPMCTVTFSTSTPSVCPHIIILASTTIFTTCMDSRRQSPPMRKFFHRQRCLMVETVCNHLSSTNITSPKFNTQHFGFSEHCRLYEPSVHSSFPGPHSLARAIMVATGLAMFSPIGSIFGSPFQV